jgi:hypothetical protein
MPAERTAGKKQLTPLWVISLFVSLTEVVLGVAASKTTGNIQIALVGFVMIFPLLIAGAFFLCLWARPWVFYPPSEYGQMDVLKYVGALKAGPAPLVRETKDVKGPVQIVGNPDRMKLLFKAVGPTWDRSTKAMDAGDGCVVQVSTRFMTAAGDWRIAEAITYAPRARVMEEVGGGRYLAVRD